jgi:hypothetical protein
MLFFNLGGHFSILENYMNENTRPHMLLFGKKYKVNLIV